MSLINDALKRARQHPPCVAPGPLPPLPPVAESRSPGLWLLPAIVVVLVAATIFSIAWAMARHSVQNVVAPPSAPVAVARPAAEIAVPVIPPPATPPTPNPMPPPAPPPAPEPYHPPLAPRLQGIFYTPTAPAAILDGKTVKPGDPFLSYRVGKITKSTVTLVDAAGKTLTLGLSN